MKCPKCHATIKIWRVLERCTKIDNPELSAESIDGEDDESGDGSDTEGDRKYNMETTVCRVGQCKTCFTICKQPLITGTRNTAYPVRVQMETDVDFSYIY
jgi:hypothetical protein